MGAGDDGNIRESLLYLVNSFESAGKHMRIVGIAQTSDYVKAELLEKHHASLRGKNVRFRHRDPDVTPESYLGTVTNTWYESGVMTAEVKIEGDTKQQLEIQEKIKSSSEIYSFSVGLLRTVKKGITEKIHFLEISITPQPKNKKASIVHAERFGAGSGHEVEIMTDENAAVANAISSVHEARVRDKQEIIDEKKKDIAVLSETAKMLGDKTSTANKELFESQTEVAKLKVELNESKTEAEKMRKEINILRNAPIIAKIIKYEMGTVKGDKAAERIKQLSALPAEVISAIHESHSYAAKRKGAGLNQTGPLPYTSGVQSRTFEDMSMDEVNKSIMQMAKEDNERAGFING